ncbi:hypothetical protein KP005_19290 [Geomonas nitrogeniifigens]|uniref:Uncharacterized protein n=1 Tax=Geomonas diazotrophica TaxID=2843197 RepID=A0ABX8JLC7_9BACT|nr:hypothetical protein [Geomonas nitrogeniifigens]QWV97452.1 hypothetical protein KP005_19290 [Geomonas nitrogeniifigens]
MAHYKFEEFKADCEVPSKITNYKDVIDDAEAFELYGKEEICDFISNADPDFFTFKNSEWLEKKPKWQTDDVMVDAYNFAYSDIIGYLAFFRGQHGKWVIKSLHPDDFKNPLKHNPFQALLGGGGLK